LSEKAIAPKSFIAASTLAQLLRREAGVPAHSSDHVRLVGKPGHYGKSGPVNVTLLKCFVQFGIKLL
jgi:hypothetical protein